MKTTDITVSSDDIRLFHAGARIQIVNGLFPRYKNIHCHEIVQTKFIFHEGCGGLIPQGSHTPDEFFLTIRAAKPPLFLKLKLYSQDLISEFIKHYR